MASVMSASPSLSGYNFQADSTGDEDEQPWTLLNSQAPGSTTSGNNSGAFSFASAPGSLNSWALVNNGHGGQLQASSQPSLSPLNLNLEFDPASSYPTSSYRDATGTTFGFTSAPDGGQYMSDGQTYLTADDMMFGSDPYGDTTLSHDDIATLLDSILPDLQIPHTFQSGPNVSPWNPTDLQATSTGDSPIFVMDGPGFTSSSSPQQYQHYHQEPSISPPASASPVSPPSSIQLKSGSGIVDGGAGSTISKKRSPAATSIPIAIRKTNNPSRVRKSTKKDKSLLSESASKSSAGSNGMSQFLIVTPDSVHANANAGQANPFECFEAASRSSHKGRKGPLADDTKHNALQVRRQGACFCCHARKVRCDTERPCRNCTKLMVQVPQVICWQFQDFLPVLFPTFIRSHFEKPEMAKFMQENIVSWSDTTYTVELSSGIQFATTLKLPAKFFTPKTADVLEHWHMTVQRNATVDLQARVAPPIGLDIDGPSGTTAQRDALRKTIRSYISSLITEPRYADQTTDSLKLTSLPRRILHLVQRYANRTGHPIVTKALGIYAMHYVMTRHLTLTPSSIASLNLPSHNAPFLTLRVLNRQIKSLIDDLLLREMTSLFEAFSKSLKPKSRKEWAPCLAAFLVLCLFMEALETTADTFVMSRNEISLRSAGKPEYDRRFALDVNREVENLPFKQFAFQFHQIYATHPRDTGLKPFNPLVDGDADGLEQVEELDGPAREMVVGLRGILGECWSELDWLCAGDILPNDEKYTFPRDVATNYTGRLVTRFLLSFTDEKYIFGPY